MNRTAPAAAVKSAAAVLLRSRSGPVRAVASPRATFGRALGAGVECDFEGSAFARVFGDVHHGSRRHGRFRAAQPVSASLGPD